LITVYYRYGFYVRLRTTRSTAFCTPALDFTFFVGCTQFAPRGLRATLQLHGFLHRNHLPALCTHPDWFGLHLLPQFRFLAAVLPAQFALPSRIAMRLPTAVYRTSSRTLPCGSGRVATWFALPDSRSHCVLPVADWLRCRWCIARYGLFCSCAFRFCGLDFHV